MIFISKVFITNTKQSVEIAVKDLFAYLEKSRGPLLKNSNEVYIKINGIDFKKHTYTSPIVLEAVIKYLKSIGAKIFVMENSTQGNLIRIVFEITGYKEICEKNGVEIIYLDKKDSN